MKRTELRLSGFGGQGLILAAYVLGKAVAVFEGRHATLNQSFGPEARGSACSAQLVVSDQAISYPYISRADILVAMSQDAYTKFASETDEGGIILIESALVTPDRSRSIMTLGLPATHIAEEIGTRIVANMAMVGFVTGATEIAGDDAVRESIRTSVPPKTQEKNLLAFERGLNAARREMSAHLNGETLA